MGATIGTFIAPAAGTAIGAGIGSTIGGLLGALGLGTASSKVSKAVLDPFIEDDADAMVKIIQNVFTNLAEEYLINKKEAEDITIALQQVLDGKLLKIMFSSEDREQFARDLLTGLFEDVARNRKFIALPSEEQFQDSLRIVLEEIADNSTQTEETVIQ